MSRKYNDDPDSTEQEIESLIGVRPDGWTYIGTAADANIGIWFRHTPSEDRPEGQPLSWDDLETLNEQYDVVAVESESFGRTGSRLYVEVEDL